MAEVTLSSKNQIVIPKGEVMVMKRPAKYHLAIQGLTRGFTSVRAGSERILKPDASFERISAFETLLLDRLL
jgi:hypothetical protein